MLTVVMLNWARPEYVLHNMNRYATYNIVESVFCFNNGPALKYSGSLPPKCNLIESSKDLGLYSRFATASLARTQAIFHTDDDLWVPECTLDALYAAWQCAPSSCHGLHGRNVYRGYERKNVYGSVEVVLTRAVICSRDVNNTALSAARFFEDMQAEPVGNGEDIVLSFAAMSSSCVLNRSYNLPSYNHPCYGEADSDRTTTEIHLRWSGHFAHRTQVVERCREVFHMKEPLSDTVNS